MTVTPLMTLNPPSRDMLHVDLYTSAIQREILCSRASSVANYLRSLGPTKAERAQGVEAICAYIESKRSRGKDDRDILVKLTALQARVPEQLREVFVKAKIESHLMRNRPKPLNLTLTLPPDSGGLLPSAPSVVKGSGLLAPPSPSSPSSSFSSDNRSSFDPSPYDRWSAALPETPMTDPTSLSGSRDSSLGSARGWTSDYTPETETENDTDSSFSAPDPSPRLESVTDSKSYNVPSSSLSSPMSRQSISSRSSQATSISSMSSKDRYQAVGGYLARVPSLLSPFALGGWGREWEGQYLDRESVLDGLSLNSFPSPPARDSQPQQGSCRGQDRSPTSTTTTGKKGSRKADSSWLSISEGCSSAFGFDSPDQAYSEGESGLWDFEVYEDDGDTITGPTSSRWSAVCSQTSNRNAPLEPVVNGPSEAARIRDAYLKGLVTAKEPMKACHPVTPEPKSIALSTLACS